MKRFVTIAVVALLGIALVAGSVYVVAQSGSEDCEEQQRGGAGQVRGADAGLQGTGQGLGLGSGNGNGNGNGSGNGTGNGNGSGNGSGSGNGNGQGQVQGQGQGQGQQRGEGQGESLAVSWVTLEGRVVAHDEELILETGDDQVLEVHTGPQWYWDENGYQVAVDDQVSVTGFEHEGEFEAGQIENETSGQLILLRDEDGRPLWSGRGRGW
jgi:hypothetical protein